MRVGVVAALVFAAGTGCLRDWDAILPRADATTGSEASADATSGDERASDGDLGDVIDGAADASVLDLVVPDVDDGAGDGATEASVTDGGEALDAEDVADVADVAGHLDALDVPSTLDVAADVAADAGRPDAREGGSDATGCAAVGMQPCGDTCADFLNDPSNCGACGHVCTALDGGLVACVTGACVQGCPPGYAACGTACVNLQTDARHCGACATDCSVVPNTNGMAPCYAGVCQVAAACSASHGDCDRAPANGCETPLNSSTNCGGCGTACATGRTCTLSGAVALCSCPTGTMPCGSGCVDVRGDVANCGACSNVCPAVPNGAATCSAGSCGAVCSNGYGYVPAAGLCATFGGAAVAGVTNGGGCTGNPYAGGACGCPAGFSGHSFMSTAADGLLTTSHLETLTLCDTMRSSGSDWGGAYLVDPTLVPGRCYQMNSQTGSCSCPGDAPQQQDLVVKEATSGALLHLVLCFNATPPNPTFLGAWEQLDAGYVVQFTHTNACLSPNARTGSCSCPGGTTHLVAFHTSAGGSLPTGAGSYVDSSAAPASIYLCIR